MGNIKGMMKLMVFLCITIGLIASPVAMAEDIAIGDSIAVGTGSALGIRTRAKVGASSCYIASHFAPVRGDRVVISAGVNDPPGKCISALRSKIVARQVIWIRPINTSGPTVDRVAAANGDSVIRYKVGRDHLHPASYSTVASQIRTEK